MTTDFDMFYASRVRRALLQKNGIVDFDKFVAELQDAKREQYGLVTTPNRVNFTITNSGVIKT